MNLGVQVIAIGRPAVAIQLVVRVTRVIAILVPILAGTHEAEAEAGVARVERARLAVGDSRPPDIPPCDLALMRRSPLALRSL